jgi:transcriptional regulator with XRE-family HTH domain
MSMIISRSAALPPAYLPELRRQVWGRLFGLSIRAARSEGGLSIEEAARLAGMEISEWMAVEDGHVPQDMNRLRAMAAVMEINFEKIFNMVLLCREAWEL